VDVVLELSDAELDQITAQTALRIGNILNTGNITFVGAVTLAPTRGS